MKKYLIKIFSVILASWMVIITGGLHLYDRSCSSCDMQEISITNIDQCCPGAGQNKVCCETQDHKMTCCKQPLNTDLVETRSCSTDNCCNVGHSYFKLDDSFNKTENILLKSFPVFGRLIQVLQSEVIAENDFNELLIIHNSSPPGFTGKAFLIFTHTLKIPLSH